MLRAPVHDCRDCELGAGGSCVFTRKTLRAGAVMVAQGGPPAEVAFVRSGVVGLSVVAGSGEQTWSAVRGPRSVIGIEAMAGAPAAFEARALTEVEVCAASVSVVRAALGSARGARALFELALAELTAQRRDVDFRTGPPLQRVARFVREFERLIGSHGARRPLSKARVASLVGIRPETLSRVLQRLRARGYLDARAELKVLDGPGLDALAEG
ncbi:MAG: Crp/Fnr family transcriptional regulator [Archangiaceae bacterium]|nr:Crp/Fnr family transcriptional regulator [Archangiaceae bacterium]